VTATFWAFMIAKDIDACCALLRGEAVSPECLDRDWLEFAAAFQLVRMDTFAIDLLHRRAELRSLLEESAA
jgi:hypothetical protein